MDTEEDYRRVIEVPCQDGATIDLDPDQLQDVGDVILLLTTEKPELGIWLEIIDHYRRQSKWDEFEQLCQVAIDSDIKIPEDREKRRQHRDNSGKLWALFSAFLMEQAKETSDPAKRNSLKNRARQLITKGKQVKANKANNLHEAYLKLMDAEDRTGRAEQKARDKDLKDARVLFDIVLTEDTRDSIARIGVARVDYMQGKYEDALQHFRAVLGDRPDCPVGIRVAIALCLAQLGRLDQATAAFARVLELEPHNVTALVATAVLEMNKAEDSSLAEGKKLLKEAYSLDNNNPNILNHLANLFFIKGAYDKVLSLSRHAQNCRPTAAQRAETMFHMARVYHIQENYDEAFKHYYKAVHEDPAFVLPHFGVAQLYIEKRKYDKAIEHMEIVYKHQPGNYESMKVLASLYAQQDSRTQRNKAKSLFQQITTLRPFDIEAWIELAMLHEAEEPAQAVELYERAIKDLEAVAASQVTPELKNNLGAVYFLVERYDKAEAAFRDAFIMTENMRQQADEATDGQALGVTIQYNLARTMEATNRINEAIIIYKQLLKEHPAYVDCYLRLGTIARERGDFLNAKQYYDDVLHFKEDGYSEMCLANICLANDGHKKPGMDRHAARQRYEKVLRADSHNIYAANGIACVLALDDEYSASKDILLQVREAVGTDRRAAQIWTNLAHLYVKQESFMEAIQLYKAVLSRFFHNRDTDILSYLMRAEYKAGLYHDAMKTSQKLVHLEPTEDRHWFNLAMCQLQVSKITIDATHNLRVAQVDRCERLLRMAEEQFIRLGKPEKRVRYNFRRAETGKQGCRDILQQLVGLRERTVRAEEEERLRQEEKRAKRLEAEELRRQQEEAQRQAQEEAEERLRIQIQQFEEEKRDLKNITEEHVKMPRAKRTKQDEQFIDDQGVSDSEEEGEEGARSDGNEGDEATPKPKKKKQQSARRRRAKVAARSAAAMERDEEEAAAAATESSNGRFKSSDIVLSDSDDDDDMVAANEALAQMRANRARTADHDPLQDEED
ncbi:uncharacterized protein MONBRDRAFT_34178 [Monosiga brevicollis MX1]|uniref:Uncharacterized protein n=1 Tax=Monosiga brevicollis TaxID=81824 RepID=A9VA17_MONBE|nr:uncharacterized protein MONBRDRAFT_34178 [Monosiga brevicollis MX1]EDQ85651.1 predicted protein [Monosiga brevicollis MX1]|eukprot:XP_001749600.1 hypothetical protein [Monosiga brevicollis MX1]